MTAIVIDGKGQWTYLASAICTFTVFGILPMLLWLLFLRWRASAALQRSHLNWQIATMTWGAIWIAIFAPFLLLFFVPVVMAWMLIRLYRGWDLLRRGETLPADE